MDTENPIFDVIRKLLHTKVLSETEMDEIGRFVDSFSQRAELDLWLRNNWNTASDEIEDNSLKLSFEDLRQKIEAAESRNVVEKKTVLLRLVSQPIAAALVGIGLLIGSWFAYNYWDSSRTALAKVEHRDVMLAPKLSGVVFTRAGKAYSLGDTALVMKHKGVDLVGDVNSLKMKPTGVKLASTEIQWSTLKVPRTKDYYVVLADGTQVWMNAGSSLSFPDRFEGKQRLVKLEGEAYFEVVSNVEFPFVVETSRELVKVTGTHFNVCCYADEPVSRVTLAEGKVAVTVGDATHKIVPGQQISVLSFSNTVEMREVDPDLYTSWRNGVFEFRDISLLDLGYRLNKWYDVDFVFPNKKLMKLSFTGMVKKTYDIAYFLGVIEKTCNVRFEIKDSKIWVSEK